MDIDFLSLAIDMQEGRVRQCPSCKSGKQKIVDGPPIIVTLSHYKGCEIEEEMNKWLQDNDINKRFRSNGTFGLGKYMGQ